MRPDSKSVSFTFHKNVFNTNYDTSNTKNVKNCRQKLQNKFDSDENDSPNDNSDRNDRSVLSVLSLNDPRRVLRNGAEKISKTFSQMRTTFGTFSQRFRVSTKRRQRLEEGPMTPNCLTPQAHSRRILGRTPTKLYSPFSIESPLCKGVAILSNDDSNKENVVPQAPPRRKKLTKNHKNALENGNNAAGWDIFCETSSTSQSLIRH